MTPIHILLVEDNEGDIVLIREALDEARIHTKLTIARDGKDAMDLLTKTDKYFQVEMPDMVLLDVNLPKKNGHEVLKFIKSDENLRHIPVVILTTSSSQKDINLSYDNHANCYLTKPVDASEFMRVITSFQNFWISIVKLPKTKGGQ